MKVVAFVPAKGSSSRIQSKNMKLLDGKPLVLHTIEKLCALDFIDEVYLDTESDEIASLVEGLPCKVLMRDPDLATNNTDGHRLFYNEVIQVQADIYIQVLCTSPFIDPETIRAGVDAVASGAHDSAVLVRSDRFYTWSNGTPDYDTDNIPNSIDLTPTTFETMGLYVVSHDAAVSLKKRIGDTPLLIEASPLDAVDVNWPEDFELANLIAAGSRERDRKLLANLRVRLSSAALSDILDDLGWRNCVARGFKSNMDAKILGRAKTLKIRALREGEDYRGIYRALESYATIVPGDIIVVENEISQFAYFGEMNANLAIRSGAVGAIIGGLTRDVRAVLDTGLPTFSLGAVCQDVKGRATLESINKPIALGGLKVEPGQLIFADGEGVVIVPAEAEKQMIQAALSSLDREKSILADICAGVPIEHILNVRGEF